MIQIKTDCQPFFKVELYLPSKGIVLTPKYVIAKDTLIKMSLLTLPSWAWIQMASTVRMAGYSTPTFWVPQVTAGEK